MMKTLQKLGKSLMLPVACLTVCGILMGIGYALAPAIMQGFSLRHGAILSEKTATRAYEYRFLFLLGIMLSTTAQRILSCKILVSQAKY